MVEQWVLDPKALIRKRGHSLVTYPEVSYEGFFQGHKFDSTEEELGGPLQFNIGGGVLLLPMHTLSWLDGAGQVIFGLDEGAATMRMGEQAKFTMDPEYAHRMDGLMRKGVPPGAVVEYTDDISSYSSATVWLPVYVYLFTPFMCAISVTLVDVENPVSDEQRLQGGESAKDEGNQLFKEGRYSEALLVYQKGLKLLGRRLWNSRAIEVVQHKQLRTSLHSNAMLCQFKGGFYKAAVSSADEMQMTYLNALSDDHPLQTLSLSVVLALDSKHAKALFNRGRCKIALGDLPGAKADLDAAAAAGAPVSLSAQEHSVVPSPTWTVHFFRSVGCGPRRFKFKQTSAFLDQLRIPDM
eukprot:gene12109-2208_t